ncbi:site-2 protease family protein [Nocardia anaemiae]|uniref:site-2 protease family protein n=1 Tax=Nocardia anaemiae TaxID=263910 RepID=UPI0007A47682|nr:site-2 protease family protein [Nocardia anaemiae]
MLRATIPLGRVAGIRIGAHWSALVTLGLFTYLLGRSLSDAHGNSVAVWLVAAAGAVGLFASLLSHELAHSIIARRSGTRVEVVVLWLLGGVSELGDEPKDPRSDLRIAVAGPLTSLVLGVALFGMTGVVAATVSGPVPEMFGWLAAMNLVLAIFNLIPGAPLDGGRVLRALIWQRTGDRLRASTIAARSGRIVGLALLILGGVELLLVGAGGGLWLMLLGWFLYSSASVELTAAGLRHRLGDIRIRDVMTEHPLSVPATWSVADLLRSQIVHTEHRVFPVVDTVGRPIGELGWSDLTGLSVAARETTAVGEVARPLPPTARVSGDELLSTVASQVVLRPDFDVITAIDPHGRLIGVVTATDLTLAVQRSALGLPARRPERYRPPDSEL